MKIRQLASIIASATLVFSTATYAGMNNNSTNSLAIAKHQTQQKQLNRKGIYLVRQSATKNATLVQDHRTLNKVQDLLTQASVTSPVIKVFKKKSSKSHKMVLVAQTKESLFYKLSPALTATLM